ncbi:MAG TPA: sensor histidine kinase N-terminal domain-containing protein [Casimicrobiaceae bacterium]|nr:sensor histidine kinase N-terminal domain-containing protein [Casimicrobiaceae bacterium]
MSLQTKLFVWLCGPLSVLWCAGVLAAYSLTERMVGLAFDQNLLATALTVSTQIKGSDLDGKPHLALSSDDERMLLFDPVDEIRYAVLDEDGATVAGARDIPLPAGIVAPGRPVFYDAPLGTKPMRWMALVAQQMEEEDPKPMRAMVVVGETLHKREALSRQTLYLATLPQIGLVALLGALVWFGLRRGLRPLHELRQRLHERSEADLHPIALDGQAREIDALRDALNGLMARLERALAAQNEFVGDAAHQLRTPLAALKARIEYAGRQGALGHDALPDLQQSVERCIRLVNQLLALAQLDAASLHAVKMAQVDLVDEVRELLAAMVGQALAKNIDLGMEATAEPLFAVTNATLLTELLRNLVDNALRYAPPGGRVTIRLEDAPEYVAVLVTDNGPGIPENERTRIFERFYRGDGAVEPGSGLGLSIARRCATVIGAELSLVPAGEGACFRVRLPREAPATRSMAA